MVTKRLQCSQVPQVFSTVGFAPFTDVTNSFDNMKKFNKHGPLFNSEYHPARIDTWGHPKTVEPELWASTLGKILAAKASVAFYVFHGGTNFGFTSGAGDHYSHITSYDHVAPLTECGDPNPTYYAVRNVIGKYHVLPNMTLPKPAPKMELPKIKMQFVRNLFTLGDILGKTVESKLPLTFQQLNIGSGFVLYSTTMKRKPDDPALLSIPGLADRAEVFVDGEYQV